MSYYRKETVFKQAQEYESVTWIADVVTVVAAVQENVSTEKKTFYSPVQIFYHMYVNTGSTLS